MTECDDCEAVSATPLTDAVKKIMATLPPPPTKRYIARETPYRCRECGTEHELGKPCVTDANHNRG